MKLNIEKKIPQRELKAMFGFILTKFQKKVEISDETGWKKVDESFNKAAIDCNLGGSASIKYAIDKRNPKIKR